VSLCSEADGCRASGFGDLAAVNISHYTLQVSTSGGFDATSTKEFTVLSQNSAPSVAVTLGLDELPFLQFGITIYMRARSSNGFTESNYSAVNVTLLVGKCRGINADAIVW
jgi:hypothetical protein